MWNYSHLESMQRRSLGRPFPADHFPFPLRVTASQVMHEKLSQRDYGVSLRYGETHGFFFVRPAVDVFGTEPSDKPASREEWPW